MVSRSQGVGACARCAHPKPPGRVKFCSDDCAALARAEREKDRRAGRLSACRRCGGPKESGVRGGKYCSECRRVIGDSSQQMEQERSRRRARRELIGRLQGGDRIARRTGDAPEGQKWCARCQEFRLLSSFSPRASGGQAPYCKPCQRAYGTERRLKLNFGITWDEYDLMLACQDGRCAICGGKPRKYNLSVDHDHKTGEIRGLLCSRCNHKLLGSANDDPARLRRAANYLEEFGPREVFGEARFVPGYGGAA